MSAMVLIAPTVTAEQHGLTTNHPFTVIIIIAAVGQIEWFLLTRGINQGDIRVMIATITDIAGQEPTTVWTPLEIDIAIRIREHKLTIHHRTYLTRSKIDDTQITTILKEGDLLTVRTVLWLERSQIISRQLLFL